MKEKTRENRLRRLAKRQNLYLKKSRVKHTNVDDWGGYMIVDLNGNFVVAGERFNLTLDEVEKFLTGGDD